MSETVKMRLLKPCCYSVTLLVCYNLVTRQVVFDALKDHRAFTFQVKQFKNTGPGDEENDPSKH